MKVCYTCRVEKELNKENFLINLNIKLQKIATTLGLKQSEAQRKNILKSAFSGQLVPQDPSDEPASILLERIKAEREALAKTTKPLIFIPENKDNLHIYGTQKKPVTFKQIKDSKNNDEWMWICGLSFTEEL